MELKSTQRWRFNLEVDYWGEILKLPKLKEKKMKTCEIPSH